MTPISKIEFCATSLADTVVRLAELSECLISREIVINRPNKFEFSVTTCLNAKFGKFHWLMISCKITEFLELRGKLITETVPSRSNVTIGRSTKREK